MIFVRTATDRDIAAIRDLLVATWHDTYDAIYGAPKVTEITDAWHSVASLTARLTQPRSEFLVADDGRALAGMAFAQAEPSGAEVALRQLYVLPTLQGRGVGGMLLDEVEDSFPEARRFVLEVEAANARARRFYRARGFVDLGPAPSNDPACSGAKVHAMALTRG